MKYSSRTTLAIAALTTILSLTACNNAPQKPGATAPAGRAALDIQINPHLGQHAIRSLGLDKATPQDAVGFADFDGNTVPFVTHQLIIHAEKDSDFRAWVQKYNAKVLDDGTIDPNVAPAAPPPLQLTGGKGAPLPPVITTQQISPVRAAKFNTGYRLVEVNLPDVSASALKTRMSKRALKGTFTVSNQQALNVMAAQNGEFDMPGVTAEANRLGKAQAATGYQLAPEQQDVWHNQSAEYVSTRVNQVWPSSVGAGVKVGIVDTGFYYYDYDLQGTQKYIAPIPWTSASTNRNMAVLYDMCQPTAGNSCANPWTDPGAENYHGAEVTGVLWGAHGNGIGGAGIAPRSDLYLYRAGYTYGAVSFYDIQRSVNLASSQGVKVLNISILYYTMGGADVPNTSLHAAIIAATNNGMIIVASAGNQGQRVENAPYTSTQGVATIPAAWPEVISVGAATLSAEVYSNQVVNKVYMSRWSGSNYGPSVDFFAPHVVRKSHLTAFCLIPSNNQCITDASKVSQTSGTSFASPYLTGVIALMLSKNPTLTQNQVRSYLLTTRQYTGDLNIDATGGFIDAKAAYDAVPAY